MSSGFKKKISIVSPCFNEEDNVRACYETVRDLFFTNMAERASKILKEDMASMGPIRLRDVDEAQLYMVQLAKDLAARGEIVISEGKGEDELVY